MVDAVTSSAATSNTSSARTSLATNFETFLTLLRAEGLGSLPSIIVEGLQEPRA